MDEQEMELELEVEVLTQEQSIVLAETQEPIEVTPYNDAVYLGTNDYNELINKPTLNGQTIQGNILIDFSDYATKEWVEDKHYLTEHQYNKVNEITDTTDTELYPSVVASRTYMEAIKTYIEENYTPNPVLIYDCTNDYLSTGTLVDDSYDSGAGLNSRNQGEGTSRELTAFNIVDADFSPYKYLRISYRRNTSGASVTGTFLLPLCVEPNEAGFFASGSNMAFGDRNRSIVCGVGVTTDKTKLSMTQGFSLYGTAVTVINNIRIIKIEGLIR